MYFVALLSWAYDHRTKLFVIFSLGVVSWIITAFLAYLGWIVGWTVLRALGAA